jgi:hypothetical protein
MKLSILELFSDFSSVEITNQWTKEKELTNIKIIEYQENPNSHEYKYIIKFENMPEINTDSFSYSPVLFEFNHESIIQSSLVP